MLLGMIDEDDDDDDDDDADDDDKVQLKVHINLPRMNSIQRGTGFQCTSNKWKDIDDWNWNCKKYAAAADDDDDDDDDDERYTYL